MHAPVRIEVGNSKKFKNEAIKKRNFDRGNKGVVKKFMVPIIQNFKPGPIAERSNSSFVTSWLWSGSPSSNPRWEDGELSGSSIAWFPRMAIFILHFTICNQN